MSLPSIVLLGCVLLAATLAIAGTAAAALAALRIKRRVEALKTAPVFQAAAGGAAAGTRITAALSAAPALIERAQAAIQILVSSLRRFRDPRAELALRTAAAALRLLSLSR